MAARKTGRGRHVGRTEAYWGRKAQSGVVVDEVSALAVSTVWRCVNLISNAISIVPWDVKRRLNRRESEFADAHPLTRRLQGLANPEMPNETFRQTSQSHVLTWGNSYAEIEKARNGAVVNLWPIEPDRVQVTRMRGGELVYDVSNESGPNVVLGVNEVYHVKGLGYDGLKGYSVVKMAREAIGLGMATERFGSSFFGNGAFPIGAFVHPNYVEDDEEYDALRADIEKVGGPDGAGQILFLEDGVEWKPIGIPPEDAQFLGTREYQVADIGPRWFGVPNNFLGDQSKSTLSNFEQMVTMFVRNTVMPWGRAWEVEGDWKLAGYNSGFFTNLNFTKLLRGDMKARSEFYRVMRELGAWNVDRILAEEDENPVGGVAGEARLVPANLCAIERAASQDRETAQQNGASGNVDGADREDEEDGDSSTALRVSGPDYTELILDAAHRIVTKERNAAGRASFDVEGFALRNEGWIRDVLRPLFLTVSATGPAASDALELFSVRHGRGLAGWFAALGNDAIVAEMDWDGWRVVVESEIAGALDGLTGVES